jgi:hypothetical protein
MDIYNRKEFFNRFVPLRTCAAMPAEGGDWGYVLWINGGRSWWAII